MLQILNTNADHWADKILILTELQKVSIKLGLLKYEV